MKFINGSDERYSVSEDGRVFSHYDNHQNKRAQPLELAPGFNYAGYKLVNIKLFGKYRTETIHKLVMETYAGSRPHGYDIDHIDGNRLNNHLNNLCYVSRTQNLQNQKRPTGVSFHTKAKKWAAYISIDKKQKHLGLFATEAEARQIVEEAQKLFYHCPSKNLL